MKAKFFPTQPPQQMLQPVEIEFFYVVYLGKSRWRVIEIGDGHPARCFSTEYTTFENVLAHKVNAIPIPIDALAAIGANLITPDSLRYPETLVAAISLCNS